MKKLISTSIVFFLLFLLGCASQEGKWEEVKKSKSVSAYESYLNEYPSGNHVEEAKKMITDMKFQEAKDGIIKAITTYIQNENGFKSLQDVSLLQAEEIVLTNSSTLTNKKKYEVWKALAKIKHICNGCEIQKLENNVAMFILTKDPSKNYEARLHVVDLQSMNPLELLNNTFSKEAETTFRYTHTKGAELNDAKPFIWSVEEYSYPKDLRPSKLPIPQMDDIKIDQRENILELKGESIFIIWKSSDKTLLINDAIARKKVSIRKGDSPVMFDGYYNFVEGRRMKFQVD